MTTFPNLMAARLARDPGKPFVTFYDEDSGERTELSATTYANWVAKTANLLVDELMLDPGDVLDLRLPPHWLGPVFLGAAWSAGLTVHGSPTTGSPDLVVTGPQQFEPSQDGVERLACSLTPFATRFAEPLPEGVQDFGVLWPGQGDVFVPDEPSLFPDPAPRDDRVLTDLDPVTEHGQTLLLELLAGDGSLVLVAGHADEERWEEHARQEQVTVTRRVGQRPS